MIQANGKGETMFDVGKHVSLILLHTSKRNSRFTVVWKSRYERDVTVLKKVRGFITSTGTVTPWPECSL